MTDPKSARYVYVVMWSSCGIDTVRSLHISEHSAEVEAARLRAINMRASVRRMELK